MTTPRPNLRMTATGAACLGLWLAAAGLAEAAPIDDGRATANLLWLGETGTSGAAPPTVLRGSAIAPRAAALVAVSASEGDQIAAGQRLWTIDRASGEVRACWLQQTPDVGVRVVRCVAGSIGPYQRGFGRAFHP